MVEEINVKAIQKQKANAEKAKKATERKAQKEEVQQENKLLKIKKNTVMNKSATSAPPMAEQKKEFVEYKDAFILSYFEVIAKSCSKYISNCDEITLKKRLMTSKDLDHLLSYLLTLQIENPVILLVITTLSHILNDSVQNKFIKELKAEQPKPIEASAAESDGKEPEQKSNV